MCLAQRLINRVLSSKENPLGAYENRESAQLNGISVKWLSMDKFEPRLSKCRALSLEVYLKEAYESG